MSNLDSNDLAWSWDGDFDVGPDGDIKDTSSDLISSLETEIRTVIRSEFGDWEKHPVLGCNLSDYRGQPNTRSTAHSIEQRITSRLVATGILKKEDISIRIIPTAQSEVLIMLRIAAAATANNRLEIGQQLELNFLYDSLEDSIFFLPTNQLERDSR